MCDYFNSTWCNIWWEWNEPNVTWLYPLPNSPQTPPILSFVEEIAQLQEILNQLQELHNGLQEWSLVFSNMNVEPKDEAIVTTITKITYWGCHYKCDKTFRYFWKPHNSFSHFQCQKFEFDGFFFIQGWKSFKVYHIGWKWPSPYCSIFLA